MPIVQCREAWGEVFAGSEMNVDVAENEFNEFVQCLDG
jgi:hypothetical protein